MAAEMIEIELEGSAAFRVHLKRYIEAIDLGTRRGVGNAASEYGKAIRENLRLKTHPPRTPTPSAPGEPPALVTGHLMRSVTQRRVRRLRAHVFIASTGPTAVYSRIHEHGGETGRNHATTLPARPYVHPAFVATTPKVRRIVRREISKALKAVH